jgi:hypothetical protein
MTGPPWLPPAASWFPTRPPRPAPVTGSGSLGRKSRKTRADQAVLSPEAVKSSRTTLSL